MRTQVRSVAQNAKKNRPSYDIVRIMKMGEKARKMMARR